jgi:uncharacterized protein (TIGR03437 family)
VVVCLALLWAATARADQAGFLLGIDYSEKFGWAGQNAPAAMAVDGSGALYILANISDTSLLPATTVLGNGAGTYVLKLSPDGGRIAYLTVLGFAAGALAVDSAGNAYVAGPDFIARLNTAGTGFVYKAGIGQGLFITSLAVDSAGHVYAAGYTGSGTLQTTPGAFQQAIPNTTHSHAFVLRLNAAGTAFDYATYLAGSNSDLALRIARDASGSAVVAGETYSTDFPTTPGAYSSAANAVSGVAFLARLAPDGSRLFYSTLLGWSSSFVAVAADPIGNAAVTSPGGPLLQFSPAGELTFSKAAPANVAVAMDSAGNVYVAGAGSQAGYPTRNSLAACGPGPTVYLSVFDATGQVLQSTYFQGSSIADGIALVPDSTVYVLGQTDNTSTYAPTQTIAGLLDGPIVLTRLSQNPAAQPVQLACIGNAGSYDPGPIAAGEIVSLFGQGLGPAQGTQPRIDLQSGFPAQIENVRVTFNGVPGPLFYVQDSQVNAIVPWTLAGAPSATVCVSYNSAQTNCIERAVAETAPGVFTTDGRHAAAVNQDGTIHSAANPATSGSIVSIFATGLGAIDPPQKDGAIVFPPLPTNQLAFKVLAQTGGIAFWWYPLETQYTGPAPYEVAGVSQLNFMAVQAPLAIQGGPSPLSAPFEIYVAGP